MMLPLNTQTLLHGWRHGRILCGGKGLLELALVHAHEATGAKIATCRDEFFVQALIVAAQNKQASVSNDGRRIQVKVWDGTGGDAVQVAMRSTRPNLGTEQPQSHCDQ